MATAEKRPVDLADDSDSASDFDDYDAPPAQTQVARRRAPQQNPPAAAAPAAPPQKEEKKSSAPSVRLDLNLEIEVTLKARIHGDLTLALLT